VGLHPIAKWRLEDSVPVLSVGWVIFEKTSWNVKNAEGANIHEFFSLFFAAMKVSPSERVHRMGMCYHGESGLKSTAGGFVSCEHESISSSR